MNCYHEPNQEIKSKLRDSIVNDSIPFYFDRFEKIVSENGGYFVNGKVCIIYIYILLSTYLYLNNPDSLSFDYWMYYSVFNVIFYNNLYRKSRSGTLRSHSGFLKV